MRKTFQLTGLFFLIIFYASCASFRHPSDRTKKLSKDCISIVQMKTDTLFNSKQIVSILIFNKKCFKWFKIRIGYSGKKLVKTSSIADNYKALAAINGGFFDRDSGGSVNYFEQNNSLISRTDLTNIKWTKPDSVANGAIVWTNKHKIIIEPAKKDQFYEESKQEAAVRVAGPLLILHSKPVRLPNIGFTDERHPRTCLCISKQAVIFVAIDGRSEQATGMTLYETQKYLLDMGCVDAINLDGGGSTTMWVDKNGVVNFPSDNTGERPVSDAILILKK